jgi:ergothioneine biosynthesis protein EgtB
MIGVARDYGGLEHLAVSPSSSTHRRGLEAVVTMAHPDADPRRDRLACSYQEVRATTEALAAPLSPEDQTVQSMPDVSPTKWHRGHTSWFFETFIAPREVAEYTPFHPAYGYIFNSYYETVGARHPRAERGLISRPGVTEVAEYRHHVDKVMAEILDGAIPADTADLVELGVHHEQQHQELLLMDIKHVLSRNPLQPAYRLERDEPATRPPRRAGWIEHPGGPVEIGHRGASFAFDNEFPRHVAHLVPFALADRAVTCGEWRAFMDDGGYERPELWLSDGWGAVQQQRWEAPLYWSRDGSDWSVFTLGGARPVRDDDPVCHVSYYEADAFAHWTGGRLPTEFEWEAIGAPLAVAGNFLDQSVLHPVPQGAGPGLFGDVWEWTSSAYSPYPGFRAPPGAVGEYNGKFMVNQYVLRGGSCTTPPGHTRATYRNFFPAAARWAFSGVRLAEDR